MTTANDLAVRRVLTARTRKEEGLRLAIKLGPRRCPSLHCSQERSSPTWTACVAHVKVDPKTGEVTLKKVTVAMDVGTIVNPDGVRAQIEGSIFWGASLAMLEKGSIKNGGIEQRNFDSYTPMRMSQIPKIDVSIIGNGERRWVAASRR